MGSEDKSTIKPSQEDLALDQYLTDLLGEALVDVANRKALHKPESRENSQKLAEQEQEVTPSYSQSISKREIAAKKSGNDLPAAEMTSPLVKIPQQKSGLHSIVQPELKLLTLKVGGLNIATPLSALSGVVSYPEVIASLSNQPNWFLGLFQYQGRKIGIVDMGGVIHQDQATYKRSLTAEPYSNVILLKGGKWAMACDEVGQIVKPLEEAIKWKDKGGSRPWLMGTITHPSAALVDLKNLIPI